MSTDQIYPAGFVGLATVRDVPDVRVICSDASADDGRTQAWFSAIEVGGTHWHWQYEIADVRPLVVLDVEPEMSPAMLARDFRNLLGGDHYRWLAQQIEAQIPPKPAEPSGHLAMVRDRFGREFVHNAAASVRADYWLCVQTGHRERWSGLAAVEVLSHGIDQSNGGQA